MGGIKSAYNNFQKVLFGQAPLVADKPSRCTNKHSIALGGRETFSHRILPIFDKEKTDKNVGKENAVPGEDPQNKVNYPETDDTFGERRTSMEEHDLAKLPGYVKIRLDDALEAPQHDG